MWTWPVPAWTRNDAVVSCLAGFLNAVQIRRQQLGAARRRPRRRPAAGPCRAGRTGSAGGLAHLPEALDRPRHRSATRARMASRSSRCRRSARSRADGRPRRACRSRTRPAARPRWPPAQGGHRAVAAAGQAQQTAIDQFAGRRSGRQRQFGGAQGGLQAGEAEQHHRPAARQRDGPQRRLGEQRQRSLGADQQPGQVEVLARRARRAADSRSG